MTPVLIVYLDEGSEELSVTFPESLSGADLVAIATRVSQSASMRASADAVKDAFAEALRDGEVPNTVLSLPPPFVLTGGAG